MKLIPTLLCDFYKVSHRAQYPKDTAVIYSTLTPRSTKYAKWNSDDKIVVFGIQAFIKEYLVEYFNENFFSRPENVVVAEYEELISSSLGPQYTDSNHIRALHKLGYLPLEIKTLPEGVTVGEKVPVMTIQNTHPDFFWLTNYFETLISCSTWQAMTSASIARQYRKLAEDYSEKTCDNSYHIPYQCHDFSMRGMSSLESSVWSGMGHLLYFKGTDTIPAIMGIEQFYEPAPKSYPIGTSIPATEHSVMSSHGLDDKKTFEFLLDLYPTGIFSVVSDTYDFWKVVSKVLPELKDRILSRDGKLVIRPDSGDPVDIICGTVSLHHHSHVQALKSGRIYYLDEGGTVKKAVRGENGLEILEDDRTPEQKGLIECLWETFGGTVNSKGFKVLDSHIGAIYGDSITLERAEHILSSLRSKGFASSNIVFGVGSYTYQYNTRDTLGFAVKSTHRIAKDGSEHFIFKDPKTDNGVKKSAKGMVKVVLTEHGYELVDKLKSTDDFSDDEMKVVFKDGTAYQTSFESVLDRANNSL